MRGAAGSGRTTWARTAIHTFARRALAIDVARASCEAESPADAIAELCEDAALTGLPAILDDAGAGLSPGSPLAAALLDVLERAPLAVVAVVDVGAAVDPRLLRRALQQVTVGPPPAGMRRKLWGEAGARAGLDVIAQETVLTPAQIANAGRPAPLPECSRRHTPSDFRPKLTTAKLQLAHMEWQIFRPRRTGQARVRRRRCGDRRPVRFWDGACDEV